MKYKVLVTGKNTPVIDDFFMQMNDNFETMTTSPRHDDIMKHISCFHPDVFVCCLNNETRETINQFRNAKYRLAEEKIPIVLLATKRECDEFERIAVNAADLCLYRPIPVPDIKSRLTQFLGEYKKKAADGAEAFGVFGSMDALLSGINASERKHILVVDDNSVMLKLIKEHLHDKYDVATAVSGKIALKFLERKKTDLILLDYEMPGDNGPAVLERLRASQETKDIPVVFLTGVTEKEKIREALILKPQSYLLKPINREKLLKTIEELIG